MALGLPLKGRGMLSGGPASEAAEAAAQDCFLGWLGLH